MKRMVLVACVASVALVSISFAGPQDLIQVSLTLSSLTHEDATALDRQVSQAVARPAAGPSRPLVRLRHQSMPLEPATEVPAAQGPDPTAERPSAAPKPAARVPDPTAERPREVPRAAPRPVTSRPRLAPMPPAPPAPSPPAARPPAKDLSGRLLDDARRVLHQRPPNAPTRPIDRVGPRGPRKIEHGRLFGKPGRRGPRGKRPHGGHPPHGDWHRKRGPGFKNPGMPPPKPPGGMPPSPPK